MSPDPLRITVADIEQDIQVLSTGLLQSVLGQISFAPSCLDMGWRWGVEELPCPRCNGLTYGSGGRVIDDCGACAHTGVRGWLIQASFRRPDTNTGEVAEGMGREWYIRRGASLSAVVKTAWLAITTNIDHETLEGFRFSGARVFGPHATVYQLTGLALAAANARIAELEAKYAARERALRASGIEMAKILRGEEPT